MVDKIINAARVELTPWMKFMAWMAVAIFATSQLVGQVKTNTEDIDEIDQNLAVHEKEDDKRHAYLIDRLHGQELLAERTNTHLENIDSNTRRLDERLKNLESYLMQYDYEKKDK